jgi:hypothetical protein
VVGIVVGRLAAEVGGEQEFMCVREVRVRKCVAGWPAALNFGGTFKAQRVRGVGICTQRPVYQNGLDKM